MKEPKKKLSRLKQSDLDEGLDRLLKGDLIYRCSFSQIAKHFLTPYFSIPTFSSDFTSIRNAYIEATSEDKKIEAKVLFEIPGLEPDPLPEEEQAFYQYICDRYLYLKKEPKESLANLYEDATKDIREIDARLIDIQQKLDEITKANDANDIQEKKPVLYFFQEHNDKAKAEILRFMLHDIKQYALRESYKGHLGLVFWWNVPYRYRGNPNGYKPRLPHDLDNKFRYLTLSSLEKLKVKYEEDKPAFYHDLERYIKKEETVFSIGNLLGQNHILYGRGEIIDDALKTYESGGKIMFAHAVPTIIEGILHELCLQIDEKENDLLQKGFQYKLDQLLPVFGVELYYEYYSFRFRIIRNKIAHGRLTKSDVDELADLMLLDLHQICKLTLSTKLQLNQKRFVIDELSKTMESPDYKYLVQYLHLAKVEVPEFYGLADKIEEVEKLPGTAGFWEFINKELDNGGETERHGVVFTLQAIKKREPFDPRCSALLSKAKLSKPDKEIAMDYLNRLRKDY
jgi:hypothetical protein